jgi:hypothetical protein
MRAHAIVAIDFASDFQSPSAILQAPDWTRLSHSRSAVIVDQHGTSDTTFFTFGAARNF